MQKRLKVALLVMAVALVGVILWQVAQPDETEPVYQGKPLSEWLKPSKFTTRDPVIFNDSPVRHVRPIFTYSLKADEAVRQAGTNAIPTLLRLLRTQDWALKVKLTDLARRQHVITIAAHTPALDWNDAGAHGFRELGAKAQSAVPQLIDIVGEDISPDSQSCAICALGYIGPSAKAAVPSLLRSATNADVGLRCAAIEALGRIHAEPEQVVPVLMNALHHRDDYENFFAVDALAKFGPDAKGALPALVAFLNDQWSDQNRLSVIDALKAIDPEAAAKAGVPVLIDDLRGSNLGIRNNALVALGQFGAAAKPAVPALVKSLGATGNPLYRETAAALQAIDPEAAAKAGITNSP